MSTEHPFAADPSPRWLQDERFKPMLKRSLRRYGIPPHRGGAVEGLVSGEIAADALFCCRTGCQPCAKDYQAAAGEILKALQRPPGSRLGLRGRLKRIIKPG